MKRDTQYPQFFLSFSLSFFLVVCIGFFPAAIQAQWSSNGSSIWSNPSSKEVGIGTTSPAKRLTVYDNSQTFQAYLYGSGNRGALQFGNRGFLQSHIDSQNGYDRVLLASGIFYDYANNRYDANSNKAYDRAGIEFLNGGDIGFFTDTDNISSNPYLTTSQWHAHERMRITSAGQIQLFPMNNSSEGGEIQLRGAGSHSDWNIDNYQSYFRLHNSGTAHLWMRDDGQLQLRKYDSGDAVLYLRRYFNGSEKGSFRLLMGTDGNTVFQQNNSQVMFFKGNRIQIGIGSDQPDAKLAVYGTIKAREINCTSSGWSDFVFDDDYELPSLEAVETFIEKNNHLPEIPSASEVEKNGVNLTEMQARLLQKIEELMLYTIAQEKRLDALETRNETLRKQLETLQQ